MDPTRPNGYPLETPIAQMTLPEQVEYWKYHSRQHETTAKSRQDYDALKAKAAQYDQFAAQHQTDQQKAIEQAQADARAAMLPQLVTANFRAELAGRLVNAEGNFDEAKLAAVLAPLDLKYFTDTSGNVDPEKVRGFATTIAPGQPAPTGQPALQFPNLGQGPRTPNAGSSVKSGQQMYEAQKAPAPPPPVQ